MIARMIVLVLLYGATAGAVSAQSFTSFLHEVERASPDERHRIVSTFVEDHPVSPQPLDDTSIVVYYKSSASSVSIAGDQNGWDPGHDPLRRIEGTDLWYRILSFPSDTRLDYKFVIDGERWILDPRNAFQSIGGFGKNSEIRMPSYEPPAEVHSVPGRPSGILIDTVVQSVHLGDERPITVYLPHRDGSDSITALLLVHDGRDFIEYAHMPIVLDNLIAERRIPPAIAVFLPPNERDREYSGDRLDEHAAFIGEEIVPIVRSRFNLPDDPSLTVVLGASNGGNVSLAVGSRYPQLIGNIAAFSSNVIPSVEERFTTSRKLALRIYLDIGSFDIPVLIPRVSRLRDILERKEYPLFYRELHDGHSYANWRAHLDDALTFLLAR